MTARQGLIHQASRTYAGAKYSIWRGHRRRSASARVGRRSIQVPGPIILALVLMLSKASATEPSAHDLLRAGRVDDAIAALAVRLRDFDHDAEAWNLDCRCHLAYGDYEAAVASCARAVDIGPRNSEYHAWLARAFGEAAEGANWLRALDYAAKSRHHFERAVELDSNNTSARVDLAHFYLEAPSFVGGSRESARQQAIAIAVSDPARAHTIFGRVAESSHDRDAAEREYRAATEAGPTIADVWWELGSWEQRQGRLDESRSALQRLLDPTIVDPSGVRVDAARMLVDAHRELPLAAELLRRYLAGQTVEDSPAFVAHAVLGSVLVAQGDREGAVHEYRVAHAMAAKYAPAVEALQRLAP